MMRFLKHVVCFAILLFLQNIWCQAEEQYLIVPLANLQKIVPEDKATPLLWDESRQSSIALRVAVESSDSEAYLCRGMTEMVRRQPQIAKAFDGSFNNNELYFVMKRNTKEENTSFNIVFKALPDTNTASRNREETSFEYRCDWEKLYRSASEKNAQTAFLLARANCFQPNVFSWPPPPERTGTPLFKQLAQETLVELNRLHGVEIKDSSERQDNRNNFLFSDRQSSQSLIRSFDLLSGSRAIEQNLELSAILNLWKTEERTIDVDTIQGVTVAEIDWGPLLKDLPEEPKLDTLAAYVPSDQHIIVFPTFAAAYHTAKLTEQSGMPVLQSFNYRKTSSDKRTFERYQKQLGLSLDSMVKQLGPAVIESIAMTGGDLYFPTGTDLTLLFETPNADALVLLLQSKRVLQFGSDKTVKSSVVKIDDRDCICCSNPARTVSSYLLKIDERTVVVSNSSTSLQRIVDTITKKNESLADLPEYRFFRDRYKCGDTDESVYAFLSDATIRRWCGPKWRIAASRRLWQQAMIAELQAKHRDAIIEGNIAKPQNLSPTKGMPVPSTVDSQVVVETEYRLTSSGVQSDTYGTYAFLTPIAELNIAKVSEVEQQAYGNWRAEYEGRWRAAFDPIGIRLTLAEDKMASDVTVMPINVRTLREYGAFLGFSEGGQFAAGQSTYDLPFQLMVSINTQSQEFQSGANFTRSMVQGVSVGWIGNYFSVFFDEDPFWSELAERMVGNESHREPFQFMLEEGNAARLPIGVEIDSKNSLQLAAFLVGLRTTVNQAAPNTVNWETLQYRETAYVKVTPQEMREMPNLAVYYTTTGGKLFVTLSETMLKKAIDRQLEAKADVEEKEIAPTASPFGWMGQNLALRVDQRAIPFLDQLYSNEMQKTLYLSAKSNIPVLNEYKRMYPDKDPLAVHRQLWGERLFCPNDGSYVWDEKFQTYRAELGDFPKHSPLTAVENANIGVTFENQGIRARVEIRLKNDEDSPRN